MYKGLEECGGGGISGGRGGAGSGAAGKSNERRSSKAFSKGLKNDASIGFRLSRMEQVLC